MPTDIVRGRGVGPLGPFPLVIFFIAEDANIGKGTHEKRGLIVPLNDIMLTIPATIFSHFDGSVSRLGSP